jgi:aspartate dehydrogenase
VEAASQKAAENYAVDVLDSGKDILIMSVGALINEEFRKKLLSTAEKNNRNILIPSGAIGALDVLRAGKLGFLSKVTLTTRKHPETLKNSQYFRKVIKDPENLKKPTIIFKGSAMEAVRAFPLNVNVAATLSLAGIGGKKTIVKVIADPNITLNIHQIEIEGEFGRMNILLENIRHPTNPRTSYLAVLSAMEMLRSRISRIRIGS